MGASGARGRAIGTRQSCTPVIPPCRPKGDIGGVTVSRWRTPKIFGFELPESDDFVILRHRGGSREAHILIGDRSPPLRPQPGWMTVIPPNTRHAVRVAGELEFDALYVAKARLEVTLQQHSLRSLQQDIRCAFRDSFLSACIDAIIGEAATIGPASERFIGSVIDSMFLHLIRGDTGKVAESRNASDPIQRVRALIDFNLSRNVPINVLAEEVGLSRSQLARHFKIETGVGLHCYRVERRIQNAEFMLQKSTMNLVDIANSLGFCSQAHFNYVFRKRVGMTPLLFRQQHTGSSPSL